MRGGEKSGRREGAEGEQRGVTARDLLWKGTFKSWLQGLGQNTALPSQFSWDIDTYHMHRKSRMCLKCLTEAWHTAAAR